MAVVAISGFVLPLMPVANGTIMAGSRTPAMTIRIIISISVNPFIPIADCGLRNAELKIRNLDRFSNVECGLRLPAEAEAQIENTEWKSRKGPHFCNLVFLLRNPNSEIRIYKILTFPV